MICHKIGVFYGLLSALFFSLYQIGTRILAPKESTITSLILAGSAGIKITSILIAIEFDPLTGEKTKKLDKCYMHIFNQVKKWNVIFSTIIQ